MISPYYRDDDPRAYQDRRAFRLGGVAFAVTLCVVVGLALLAYPHWIVALIWGGVGALLGMMAADITYERYRPRR